MELCATQLHFLGDTLQEQKFDYCVHGKVVCILDGVDLSNDVSDWCVSASAYRFLQSLFKNHVQGAEEHLIPCCGHFLLPSADRTRVTIYGCPNGIDFDVIHENGRVVVRVQNGSTHTVSFDEYRTAVLAYAKQIEDFYHQNPPRQFQDPFDQEGFSAFCQEWYDLMRRARALSGDTPTAPVAAFDAETSYMEKDVAGISPNGIALKTMQFIHFGECARNFYHIHGGSGRCVAERDITAPDPWFGFYTSPKMTRLVFQRQGRLKEFLAKKDTLQRFQELKRQIESFGFTTFDLS